MSSRSPLRHLERWGKTALSSSLWRVLGRRNYVRLGRFLWMQSRLDVPNDPSSNGERLLQRAFARSSAAAPNLCIFDVGANVGDWTAAVARELDDAGIDTSACAFHLFEPSGATLERARRHLLGNVRDARITFVECAVADRCEQTSFFVYGETHGSNTLRPTAGDGPGSRIEVTCITLDKYCEDHGISRIDLLKVDTEGADYDVLAGAQALLRDSRLGLVQFEYNHRWVTFRRFLKDVFDLVVPLGYSVGKITPLGIEAYRAWHPELETFREGNYLLWRGSIPAGLPLLPWWLDD